MKVLYCYFQPKIIPEVLEKIDEIKCDKLFLKFMKYPDVYIEAMKFFRENKEYTHFFWHSNDTIIPKEDFERLCQEAEVYDSDVLGMACNVDLTDEGMKLVACSFKAVEVNHNSEIQWVKKGEFKDITNVAFNGCPQLIKRKVLLDCPLLGDSQGFNADVKFCNDLRRSGFITWVDFSFNILHLRYKGELLVGKRTPEVKFIPCK